MHVCTCTCACICICICMCICICIMYPVALRANTATALETENHELLTGPTIKRNKAKSQQILFKNQSNFNKKSHKNCSGSDEN